MSRSNRNRQHATRGQFAAHRRRRAWVLAAVLAVAAAIVVRIWLPADPRHQFEQALAAYPDELARTESLLRAASASAVDSVEPDVAVLLGCVAARRRDWKLVELELARVDLNAVRTDLLGELGELAIAADRTDLAVKVLAAAARRPGPEQAPSLFMMVVQHQAAGRMNEAVESAEQLTRVAPRDARWWRLLAALHSQRGDEVAEAGVYRRALQETTLPPADARVFRHQFLEKLIQLGDAGEARNVLEQLESSVGSGDAPNPNDQVRLDANRARLLRLEGKSREALVSLDRAMPALEDVALARRLRGMLLMDLGEFEAAAAELTRAVEMLPVDEVLHYKLAEVFRRIGEPEKSRHHLLNYQRLHAARLEIGKLEAKAADQPLTPGQRARLAELHRQVGDASGVAE